MIKWKDCYAQEALAIFGNGEGYLFCYDNNDCVKNWGSTSIDMFKGFLKL
jgi:hypothetical protein